LHKRKQEQKKKHEIGKVGSYTKWITKYDKLSKFKAAEKRKFKKRLFDGILYLL